MRCCSALRFHTRILPPPKALSRFLHSANKQTQLPFWTLSLQQQMAQHIPRSDLNYVILRCSATFILLH